MKRTTTLALTLTAALAAVPQFAVAQAPRPATPADAQMTRPATQRTLEDRVEYRLETDASVKKYDIDVDVEGSVVKLSGSVATAAQKAAAERVAKIDGVTTVVNDIKVDPDADKSVADWIKAGLSKTGDKISDTWINSKVSWFFVGEDTLKDSNINVDTKNNVVTLKGTVKSQAGRARAIELARQTDGVKSVVDQLVIK